MENKVTGIRPYLVLLVTLTLSQGCSRNAMVNGHSVQSKSLENKVTEASIAYSMSVTPSSKDMAEVAISATGTVTLTIANSGNGNLTQLAFSNISAPWSYTSAGTCGTTLEAGKSCTKIISLKPTAIGQYSLTVNVSADNVTKQSVTLTANGYQTISVAPVYPNNSKWNDYVKRADTNKTNFAQADTACTTSDTGIGMCFHSGIMRKSTITGLTSCTGVSVEDSLGALNWLCLVESGVANAYSFSLKEDKRLGDLVDASAWKSIRLVIKQSNKITHMSDAGTWWTNTVTPLPDNSGTAEATSNLSSSGTVYTLMSSRATRGYNVTADRIAIAMPTSVTLSPSGSTFSSIIASAASVNFLWIEGNVLTSNSSGATVTHAIYLSSGKRNRVRSANVTVSGGYGYRAAGGTYNYVSQLKASFVVGTGIKRAIMESGLYNVYDQIVGNGGSASGQGIHFSNDGYIMTRVNFSQHSGTSCALDNGVLPSGLVMHAVTLTSNFCSLSIASTPAITSAVVANNAYGLNFYAGSAFAMERAQLANVVATNNDSVGMYLDTPTASGNILLGNNVAGACTTATTYGASDLANTTCAAQNGSTANVLNGISVANSFVGLNKEDTKNSSDTLGVADFSVITDFLNFDNFFKSWGYYTPGMLASGSRSGCFSGSCMIADWRLSKYDTVLLNKSNNGMTTNDPFVANQACPQAVSGSKVMTTNPANFASIGSNTYLINAVEIPDDPYGNSNGLCESGEMCIYHPNYGAYLGEGDWLNNGTCIFENGTVTNVTMYAYPTNGG